MASSTIGPYVVTGKLGEGGMGVVLRARHPTLPLEVAIKVLKASALDDEGLARFRAEVLALARIQHPNVVPVLDAGRAEDGSPYAVMPLISGRSLEAELAQGPLAIARAASLVARIARGVHAAHASAFVIHRDIKPSNVIVDATTGEPRLLDFGVAKSVSQDSAGAARTRTGAVVGTPEFMAPEQALGDGALVDARTDVYGLGALLYALLVGRPPFANAGRGVPAVLADVCLREPRAPRAARPEVPRDLDAVVRQAMAKDRDRRHASALELALDLERFLAGEPVLARPPGRGARASRFVARNGAWVFALVFMLVAAVAISLALWFRASRALDRARAQALVFQARAPVEQGAIAGSEKARELRALLLEATELAARDSVPRVERRQVLLESAKLLLRARFLDEAEQTAEILARADAEAKLEALDIVHRVAHAGRRSCDAIRARIRSTATAGPYADELALEERLAPARRGDWMPPVELMKIAGEARETRLKGKGCEALLGLVEGEAFLLASPVDAGRLGMAVDALSQSLAAGPDDPRALGLYALCLALEGRLRDSEWPASRALERDPQEPAAHLARAIDRLSFLELDLALVECDAALAAGPNALAFGLRAKALVLAGRFEEGAATADRALAFLKKVDETSDQKLTPYASLPHAARGWALLGLGRPVDALEDLKRAPDSAWGWAGYARALALTGSFEEAGKVFADAMLVLNYGWQRHDPSTLVPLAEALEEGGGKGKARELVRACLEPCYGRRTPTDRARALIERYR